MTIDRAGMAADLYDMAARAWGEMMIARGEMMIASQKDYGLGALIRFRNLQRHYKACLVLAKELSFP